MMNGKYSYLSEPNGKEYLEGQLLMDHPTQLPSGRAGTAAELLFLTMSCGIEDLFMV